jgi:hypothetical protein
MKARYDRQANSAEFQEGDQVWLYRTTRTRGKLPKLQSAWEGPYNVITRINYVVYLIQRHPRARMMVCYVLVSSFLSDARMQMSWLFPEISEAYQQWKCIKWHCHCEQQCWRLRQFPEWRSVKADSSIGNRRGQTHLHTPPLRQWDSEAATEEANAAV